jgi:hypothetical protein
MNHSSKKLATAVAGALAMVGVSSAASAAYFEPWTVAGSEPFPLRLAGATAQDKGLILLMRRICAAGTMVRVQGTTDSAMMCEANGTDSAPIATGTKVVFYKNSNGGSSRGVNPVADSTNVTFVNLGSLTQAQYTTSCTITTTASTADFADYKNYACGSNLTTVNQVPDAGISDVEPSLLGWVSGVNGALDTFAGPQLLFGVPVSKNFRDALQTAQSSTLPANCVGKDSEACMPSLTSAQVAALYTGGVATVARFSDDSGNVLATPAGGSAVQICRRKNGSGTLAGTRAFFLNEGCAKGVKGFVSGLDGDANYTALPGRIAEYSGTNGVIGCLNLSHALNKYAVGMSSVEFKPGTAYAATGRAGEFNNDAGNWGWVKIGGYAPTLLNAVQSRYTYLYEASYQHRTGGLTGDKKTLFDLIVAQNSSAAVIRELDNGFTQSSGADLWYSGLLGKPGSPTAPSASPAGKLTSAEVVANPVNTWTRAASGSPNSCNPPYIGNKETGLDL